MKVPDWVFSLAIGAFGSGMVKGANSMDPLSNVTKFTGEKQEQPGVKEDLSWNAKHRTSNLDPLIEKANEACSRGEISGCFKASAMVNVDWFLSGKSFSMTDHARIVQTTRESTNGSARGPSRGKFSWSSSRSTGSPSWSELLESVLQRVEAFAVEAFAPMVEVALTDEMTQDGRYAPRFIDEIAAEVDALEDKNDNIFSRTKMKKLLIPLLLVLKVFKLKLLLFLPLILGLASFKKLIGFLIIALPAIIGFLKICKPDLSHSYGSSGHSSYYNLPPHRRYQVASVYSRVGGAGGHGIPLRFDPARERDVYQYAGISYQNYPSRNAQVEDPANARHHLAYNSYHGFVNK